MRYYIHQDIFGGNRTSQFAIILSLSPTKPSIYKDRKKWNLQKILKIPLGYPLGESNAYRRNRNPEFYPLN